MQGTVTDPLPSAPGALDALSPVDGRYADKCAPLRALLSEAALIRQRVRIEAEWFLFLARELALPELASLAPAVRARAEALARAAGPGEAAAVKAEEQRIAHDVKAVEYHLRAALGAAGASAAQLEFVHFACTSEDINNLAYALMLKSAREAVLLPAVDRLQAWLVEHAHRHAGLAMLSRTHGQPATPTTLGKELANVAQRLARARAVFAAVPVLGKMNGAVGNWNAHAIAYPDVDWRAASRRFVEALGLGWNEYTVQIEPHDWIAEYCDALARLDTVLIDFARDAWGYVSLGYFRQRLVAGEVGSSTMPHKVNPIDFENGEGNLGLANALLRHFADKLPVSRWQRDLSDSTVLRNVGVALAHALLAFLSIERGLGRLEPDPARLAADLDDNWEVLGEALQTVMRRYGVPNAYERLKSLTRGRRVDAAALAQFIATLPLPAAERERLARLTPADYIGLARELAGDA
jgi:adenylosuccinate lyase